MSQIPSDPRYITISIFAKLASSFTRSSLTIHQLFLPPSLLPLSVYLHHCILCASNPLTVLFVASPTSSSLFLYVHHVNSLLIVETSEHRVQDIWIDSLKHICYKLFLISLCPHIRPAPGLFPGPPVADSCTWRRPSVRYPAPTLLSLQSLAFINSLRGSWLSLLLLVNTMLNPKTS